MDLWAQIVKHGRVVRPGLGVICIPDAVMVNALRPQDRGVIVKDVVPGSGAAQAGLRQALLVAQHASRRLPYRLANNRLAWSRCLCHILHGFIVGLDKWRYCTCCRHAYVI